MDSAFNTNPLGTFGFRYENVIPPRVVAAFSHTCRHENPVVLCDLIEQAALTVIACPRTTTFAALRTGV